MKKISMLFLLTVIFAIGVQAQTTTPKINQKQKQQHARINQGIKTGELTNGEIQRLKNQQLKIQHDKKMAKSDGLVTERERSHILNEQQRSSKNIFRKKHNSIVK
jgi:hypothetical protein